MLYRLDGVEIFGPVLVPMGCRLCGVRYRAYPPPQVGGMVVVRMQCFRLPIVAFECHSPGNKGLAL
jgi:hypothetical protein